MKNVIITLDEQVALRAPIKAVERNVSLSRLVGELLHKKMLEEEQYQTLMQYYLSQPLQPLKAPGTSYPDRDELYDR